MMIELIKFPQMVSDTEWVPSVPNSLAAKGAWHRVGIAGGA